jgi:hypothetical protein
MTEYKLLPMTKVREPLPHMSPLLNLKDSLVTQPKIRLLKTHSTQSSTPNDLLEENSMIQLFNLISNIGPSKFKEESMENQTLLLNSKVN